VKYQDVEYIFGMSHSGHTLQCDRPNERGESAIVIDGEVFEKLVMDANGVSTNTGKRFTPQEFAAYLIELLVGGGKPTS
jgi:hypothetical protein